MKAWGAPTARNMKAWGTAPGKISEGLEALKARNTKWVTKLAIGIAHVIPRLQRSEYLMASPGPMAQAFIFRAVGAPIAIETGVKTSDRSANGAKYESLGHRPRKGIGRF